MVFIKSRLLYNIILIFLINFIILHLAQYTPQLNNITKYYKKISSQTKRKLTKNTHSEHRAKQNRESNAKNCNKLNALAEH